MHKTKLKLKSNKIVHVIQLSEESKEVKLMICSPPHHYLKVKLMIRSTPHHYL